MVKQPRNTSVTLHGGPRIQCSPDRKQSLLERLQNTRLTRTQWTIAAWRSAARAIKAMSVWGATKHGGPRRRGSNTPASGGEQTTMPASGGKVTATVVPASGTDVPGVAGSIPAAAKVRRRLRQKQPPSSNQGAVDSVLDKELASGRNSNALPLSMPEELVMGESSVSEQRPVELASGSMQDAPAYACTFGHVINKAIGRGSYGKVFTARRHSGDKVAIKHIECMPHDMHSIEHEITALQQLKHPNIVTLLEVNKTSFAVDLVFEHCELTLRDVIRHHSKSAILSSTVTCHFALLLFKAFAYVHETMATQGFETRKYLSETR